MKKLLFAIALIAGSNQAFSKEMSQDKSSGCGYGWEVMKDQTLLASSVRSTTNGTASNSIAMTMGTSGCAKHDIVLQEKQQLHFANSNYEMIVAEMANGQGEYLNSFADVLGCDNVAFGASAQANLETIIADNGSALLSNVKNNAAIRKACL
jgi:hypothetical protein